MKVLDLFSGIGGFSLGLERAGMETIAFCEFDEHARKVLAKHWPEVPIHKDVRELDGKQYRGTVDVVCGGFPCQDLSVAGKKAGFGGERSSLYREMLRIIGECGPRYAIFENVTGLLTGESGRWFGQFLYDLAQIGYDAEWHCISASELGAHHHRDRVWIIAYPKHVRGRPKQELGPWSEDSTKFGNDGEKEHVADSQGIRAGKCGDSDFKEGTEGGNVAQSDSGCSDVPDTSGELKPIGIDGGKPEGSGETSSSRSECPSGRGGESIHIPDTNGQRGRSGNASGEYAKDAGKPSIGERIDLGRLESWDVEPSVGRVANGVSGRAHRLKQLGNGLVPVIPERIGRAIMEANQ